MKRFILLSFAFLGLAFYELSGGADFDPVTARNAAVLARSGVELAPEPSPNTVQIAEAEEAATVTRMSLNLTALDDVLASDPAPRIRPEPERASVTALTFSDESAEQVILPSLIFPGTTSQASSDAVTQARDLRTISADRVNMRGGPGTGFDVLTQLERDTRVEILQDTGTGWVKLRPLDGGPEGWIADFLLTSG